MIDLDLFFDIPRDVAMATDFVQKWGNFSQICSECSLGQPFPKSQGKGSAKPEVEKL